MKLTVPAIRAVRPGPERDDAAEETKELLDAIDALLAESMAEAPTREMETAPPRCPWRCTRLRALSRLRSRPTVPAAAA